MSNTRKETTKKPRIPATVKNEVTLPTFFILAFIFLTVFVPLSSAEDAGEERTILVGTYENSPKIYTDEQGKTAGLFPDILNYIAELEGWEIRYVHGTWTENLERLEKNEIDIMPDMAYSEERAEIYDFNNESVLINWGILYTQKDSAIQSIPDLQGKKVAVMNGSIHTVGAEGIFKLCERFDVDCTFIGVDDYTEVFRLLDMGEADAGVVNRLFGALHEHEFDVEKTNVVFEPVDLRFAFPKNSTLSGVLIERIDDDLRAMKKDPNSIYYRALETHLSVPEETKIPDWAVPAFLGLLGLVALFCILSTVLKWQVNARTAELRAANEALEQDIIERKKVEEALLESEERYRHFFETSSDAVFITTKEGRWVDCNDAAVGFFGYESRDALRAVRIADLYENPAERKKHIQLIEEQGFTKDYPVNLRKKDGSIINALITSVVWRDEAGKVVGFQGTIRDVTEQKRAEAALLEALKKREELEVIINNSLAIVFLWRTAEGWPVEFVSDNVQQWGYTPADFYSGDVPYANIIYHPDLERVASEVDQYSQEGRNEFTQEYRIITKTGEIRWLDDRTWIRRDARGVITHYQGIVLDITERKRMEEERGRYLKELEQRNAEMERFAYTISHELRTPLVTLQGYTDLLQRDLERRASEKVAADLRFIQNAVTSMARLLEDTLELSRTGRILNPPIDVHFGAVVRDALHYLAELLTWSGVNVSVAADFPVVQVDRDRIVEALVNLIENSIKFIGDQTRPRIEIGSRKEGEETVFFVKDNGIGLDKSQHGKVFELFYKVDKKSKGSGAGLAIVKRIIEVHGGRIWIESEKGKGCTVCFTLPVA